MPSPSIVMSGRYASPDSAASSRWFSSPLTLDGVSFCAGKRWTASASVFSDTPFVEYQSVIRPGLAVVGLLHAPAPNAVAATAAVPVRNLRRVNVIGDPPRSP